MGKKKITKGVVLQWCWSTWTDTKIAVKVVMDIADVETVPKTVENNDEKKIHQHFQCSFCRTDSFCESPFLRLNVMFWHILNEVQKVQEPLFCPKWNKNIFHQNQTHFSYTLPSISSVSFTLLGKLLWKSRTHPLCGCQIFIILFLIPYSPKPWPVIRIVPHFLILLFSHSI